MSLGGTIETVACITLLKDLDRPSSDAIIQLAFPDSQSLATTPKSSFSAPPASPGGGYQYTRPTSGEHTLQRQSTTPSEYISSGGRSLYGSAMGMLGHSTGSELATRARDKSYSDMLDAEEEHLGLDRGSATLLDYSSDSVSLSEVTGETAC